MSSAHTFENIIIGCGSKGLATLSKLLDDNPGTENLVIALEASSRIGGTQFLISRTVESGTHNPAIYEVVRELPELKIWWERNWVSPSEVNWSDKDWAYTLPQWQNYFKKTSELKIKTDVLESLKPYVLIEKPVSEINYENGLWSIRSGEKLFLTKKLHWTLGLKALQSCVGKKQAEEYMEKNPNFNEAARDAEGVFAANYTGAIGEAKFVALPVRHDHKLYLCFASLNEGQVESFTFLHNDILKHPKELSSFEKSIKRTLKHTLSESITELSNASVGVLTEAKGYSMASPWKLKHLEQKSIYFVNEELGL